MSKKLFVVCAVMLIVTCSAEAQANTDPSSSDLTQRVAALSELVEKLQARVSELEAKAGGSNQAAVSETKAAETPLVASPVTLPSGRSLLGGTTVNFLFDGYYGYNFNNPIGRVNLLRTYDISSNSFSLNQADLVLENAPDPDNGKRFGVRLDLQFGQATETLQGNTANETRPEIYRNIFQAYGTYVFPVGKGLTVDFGKFASSLGIEGNYTKDQMNYSRSFWFDFLPYYHMGVRANYKVSDALSINYWMTNGTEQTEANNNYKDEFIGLTIQPSTKINWNANYYIGQEHPDLILLPNGGAPAGLPTEQGTPFEPIPNSPKGKLHILDSYVTWHATQALTLALEGDYVIERRYTNSSPQHTDGWVGYLQYGLTPKLSVAGRAEYLSDRGGLFTGVTQAVKETTFTTRYLLNDGLMMFGEWRRDFSNRPYFLTDELYMLKKEQSTATLGVVWWFGGKQGIW